MSYSGHFSSSPSDMGPPSSSIPMSMDNNPNKPKVWVPPTSSNPSLSSSSSSSRITLDYYSPSYPNDPSTQQPNPYQQNPQQQQQYSSSNPQFPPSSSPSSDPWSAANSHSGPSSFGSNGPRVRPTSSANAPFVPSMSSSSSSLFAPSPSNSNPSPFAPFPSSLSSSADFLNNPMARFAMNSYGSAIGQQVGGLLGFFSLHKLKIYFSVDNSYVGKKLSTVLFPFRHSHWKRERHDTENEGIPDESLAIPPQWRPPTEDVNAPDLYIPLMSLITYILLMSYCYAQQQQFHPEVIGTLASRSLAILIMELLIIKSGIWLISSPSQPYMLDLVAYCSYKFVPCIVVIFSGLLLGTMGFYSALVVFGLLFGLFIIRTFKLLVTPTIDSEGLHGGAGRRKYFLLIMGALQLLICGMLVKGAI